VWIAPDAPALKEMIGRLSGESNPANPLRDALCLVGADR
jgi:hypothetical protein